MRATERNLSHDEADKIELICKNIGQQTDYDWTKDMKKLSPGAKFILYEEVAARFPCYLSSNMHSNVTIMCRNDELSSKMGWIGCLLKGSELLILFEDNCQIFLKISLIPIFLTFIYPVALNLLVNNQLNSSLRQIIVTLLLFCLRLYPSQFYITVAT